MFATRTNYLITTLMTMALLTGGCATMDQTECQTANWYDVGLGDGETGRKVTRYTDYQEDCSEYGVSVDTIAYEDGWSTGIARYCTRDNGYRVGTNGTIYQDSCPTELEDTFFNAYQLGRAVHNERARVDSLQHEVEEIGDDLAKTDLTEQQRSSLAEKREDLKDQLESARITLALAIAEARKHGFAAS